MVDEPDVTAILEDMARPTYREEARMEKGIGI